MEPPDERRDRARRSFRKESDDYPLPTESEMWRENLKQAMKEAVKEWLDERFASFGKWSLSAVLCAALAAMVWFIITVKSGGKAPPP